MQLQRVDHTSAELFCSVSRFVLVLHCCITNYPKTEQFKTLNVYYLTVSGGQVCGSCLADSSRLSAFGAAASEGSTGTGKPTSKKACSHDHWREVSFPLWFLERVLHFLHVDSPQSCWSVLMSWHLASPRVSDQERAR